MDRAARGSSSGDLHGVAASTERLGRNPGSMEGHPDADGHAEERHRAGAHVAGIEHRKIAMILRKAVDNGQQVAVAFFGIWPARNKLRFLNGARRSGTPTLHLSCVVIYVADGRTAVGAPPRHHVAVLVAISLVAIVCSRQFSGNARQRPQPVSIAIREVEGELREYGRRRRKRLAGRGGEKVEARTVIETDIEM